MCLSAASGGSERKRTRQDRARAEEARRMEEQKYADYAFAKNGFRDRDDFIGFYRADAEESVRRVERRRRSREDV